MKISSSPIPPPNYTNPQHHLPFILHNLDTCKSMDHLKQLHTPIIKTNHLQTNLIWSKLISFSALSPFGNLDYALSVFTHLQNPSLNLHNIIIRSLSSTQTYPLDSVLLVYQQLFENGLSPDKYTLPFVLKACARWRAMEEGKEVHGYCIKTGFVLDVYVRNTLMRIYAVCGVIHAVQKLFDESRERDLVTWTTLIQGYAKMGFSKEAVRVFFEMEGAGLRADGTIMVVVISACSKLGDLGLGKKIHKYMQDSKVNLDVFVWNALIDMYLKCGDVNFACKLFKEMPKKNVVSWNSMIVGLAQQGEFKKALSVFRRMQGDGVKPDDVTLVGVLNSCANLGVLELGEWAHAYIDKNRTGEDGYIGNALVDMYAKCGRIDQAFGVFKGMKCRDVYSYTGMIVGLAMHGQGEKALHLFSEMSQVGIKPDEVTYIGILSACSHAGLVEEGYQHFENMSRVYNLSPQIEHYGCMVDLLGRAGLISEAEEFIKKMPIEPDSFIWGALLGACKIHGKVELGESIMKKLVEAEPKNDGAYVLMSNMYASENRWKDAVKVRKVMKEQHMKKTPGCSVIELDGVTHEFRKGDKSHPRMKEIYMMVDEITSQLKKEGYVTQTSNALLNVTDEEKVQSLCQHSERLAIAFGLISTKPQTPLKIVKNLRVC